MVILPEYVKIYCHATRKKKREKEKNKNKPCTECILLAFKMCGENC